MSGTGYLMNSNFTLQMQMIPTKKKPSIKPVFNSRKVVTDKQPLPHSLQAFHQKKLYGSNPVSKQFSNITKIKNSPIKSVDKNLVKSGFI